MILTSGLSLPAVAGGTIPDLDAFLGGVETRCRGSDAFEEFAGLLAERHVPMFRPPLLYARRAMPDVVRWALGKETVSDKGSHAFIAAPLAGTFRGLEVSGIELAVKHGTGPYAFAIVFASDAARVREVLGPTVDAADRALRAERGSSERVISIMTLSGHPKLTCDAPP